MLTDSSEIAEVATENGAEVPYLRCRKTSSDKAGMLSVLLEFVDFSIAKNGNLKTLYCSTYFTFENCQTNR